jgi:F420-dependent oxidoreductase-like protein
VRVCLMIEGQEGVSWEQWLELARACEDAGLEGLFRSDHYSSLGEPAASLDAWATLAALAMVTERIRLGTLVSPVTFRPPSVLAKSALVVDHVSGGRVEVGLGAGWMELEHRAFGFPFPDVRTRLVMLAEQAEIIDRQLRAEPFSFEGEHYRLEDCKPLPEPVQRPRPPLIVGGTGGSGTIAPAVRFADEYNTFYRSPDECRELRAKLDRACERESRDPAGLPLSLMTGCVVGEDDAEVKRRVKRRGGRPDPERMVLGTLDEAAEQLRAYENVGVVRVMLQHLDHSDDDMVALLGRL